MYRNLFDKHKERSAFITEDYKRLIISYELGLSALAFNKESLIQRDGEFFSGKIAISLENNRHLILEIEIPEPDLTVLYQITLVTAYALGGNLHLQYFNKSFPHYTTDTYFNLDTHIPTNPTIFRAILDRPSVTLNTLLTLLNEPKSYFNALVPAMLCINSFPSSELVFVTEYGLLEGLARKNVVRGVLYDQKVASEKYTLLGEFSAEIQNLLREKYNAIDVEQLHKKLALERLNEVGSTKEKITLFLKQFENPTIREYVSSVHAWNSLRSQTIVAHGVGKFNVRDSKVYRKSRDLHELLLQIVNIEVLDWLSRSYSTPTTTPAEDG